MRMRMGVLASEPSRLQRCGGVEVAFRDECLVHELKGEESWSSNILNAELEPCLSPWCRAPHISTRLLWSTWLRGRQSMYDMQLATPYRSATNCERRPSRNQPSPATPLNMQRGTHGRRAGHKLASGKQEKPTESRLNVFARTARRERCYPVPRGRVAALACSLAPCPETSTARPDLLAPRNGAV